MSIRPLKFCAFLPLAVMLFVALPASSDTLLLKNGAQIDGVIQQRPDGLLQVKAGSRTVIYRQEEIESIEKNAKTGALDLTEVKARWAAHDAEMTQMTGLTAEQRKRIDSLIYMLQTADTVERVAARDRLASLQSEMDVFGYVEFKLPELSHRVSPGAIEVLAYIDGSRAKPILQRYVENEYFGSRARAIELLAMIGDLSSSSAIVRGLVDAAQEVKLAALKAIGQLDIQEATPAVIELLGAADLRIVNGAKATLEALWSAQITSNPPTTPEEWQGLWQSQAANVGGAMKLASLTPLVAPEEEFQDE